MGKSGIAAARVLADLGGCVTITDKKPIQELESQITMLRNAAVSIEAGGHPERLFLESDLIVLSPGVPKILPLLQAQRHGVTIISELELAWQISNAPYIGITGTNGKSTVTTLVGLMLEKAGRQVLVAGNIGNALTDHVHELKTREWIVAELSSFQLEDIHEFRPKIGAILNLTQDHLDRYHTLEEYGEAKARVFMNQRKDDFLILNFDDPLVKSYANQTQATVVPFSRLLRFNPGACVHEGFVTFNGKRICRTDEIRIQGVHNLENALAAAAISLSAGADKDAVAEVLREFSGLEHRLEFVREKNGVRYINDSKGTNVGAVIKSVESFHEPVILIAGGYDKGSDFSPLYSLFKEKVKLLILIGKAADKMQQALDSATETIRANTLEEAVQRASQKASSGDVVLLSPACASFDMFKDFEDRGKQFKEAVRNL